MGVTHDTMERVAALVSAGVDAIGLDTAHGHSLGVLNMVEKVRAAGMKPILVTPPPLVVAEIPMLTGG